MTEHARFRPSGLAAPAFGRLRRVAGLILVLALVGLAGCELDSRFPELQPFEINDPDQVTERLFLLANGEPGEIVDGELPPADFTSTGGTLEVIVDAAKLFLDPGRSSVLAVELRGSDSGYSDFLLQVDGARSHYLFPMPPDRDDELLALVIALPPSADPGAFTLLLSARDRGQGVSEPVELLVEVLPAQGQQTAARFEGSWGRCEPLPMDSSAGSLLTSFHAELGAYRIEDAIYSDRTCSGEVVEEHIETGQFLEGEPLENDGEFVITPVDLYRRTVDGAQRAPFFGIVAVSSTRLALPFFGRGGGDDRATRSSELLWERALVRDGSGQVSDLRPLTSADLPTTWTSGCLDVDGDRSNPEATQSQELVLTISEQAWTRELVQYPDDACAEQALRQFPTERYEEWSLAGEQVSENGYRVASVDLGGAVYTIVGISEDGRRLFEGIADDGFDGSRPDLRHQFLDHFNGLRPRDPVAAAVEPSR